MAKKSAIQKNLRRINLLKSMPEKEQSLKR